MPIKILGLDISTSNIGICVADESDHIYEFISIPLNKLVKDGDLFKKLMVFDIALDKVLQNHDITHTFVERPMEFFQSGSSMAHTIIILSQFNILCQYKLGERKMNYTLVAPTTALKAAIGRGTKPTSVKDKKAWLAKVFEGMHPEIELKRYTKGKNEGEIHSEMYDPVDAGVMTRCTSLLED